MELALLRIVHIDLACPLDRQGSTRTSFFRAGVAFSHHRIFRSLASRTRSSGMHNCPVHMAAVTVVTRAAAEREVAVTVEEVQVAVEKVVAAA